MARVANYVFHESRLKHNVTDFVFTSINWLTKFECLIFCILALRIWHTEAPLISISCFQLGYTRSKCLNSRIIDWQKSKHHEIEEVKNCLGWPSHDFWNLLCLLRTLPFAKLFLNVKLIYLRDLYLCFLSILSLDHVASLVKIAKSLGVARIA